MRPKESEPFDAALNAGLTCSDYKLNQRKERSDGQEGEIRYTGLPTACHIAREQPARDIFS